MQASRVAPDVLRSQDNLGLINLHPTFLPLILQATDRKAEGSVAGVHGGTAAVEVQVA